MIRLIISKSSKNSNKISYPIWHPYTQMRDWNKQTKIVITRGDGFYLIDQNGKRYLDGIASMWCNVWGHGKNEIVKTMVKQLHTIQHSTLFGLSSSASIELAESLLKIAKGMHHVFYSDNGSTAIEVAMKMALQYWRNKGNYNKVRFISMEDGYHGDTIGAMSIGYISKYFSAYRPIINPAIRIPAPPSVSLHEDNQNGRSNRSVEQYYIDQVEDTLSKHSNNCCALVMESGAQVAGGVRIYPKRYQMKVSHLCKKYGVLLILDEIATGFGRLGNMVEYLSQSSIPDIVCFGKSLTAGYSPLAVTLTTNEIFSKFLGSYSDNKQLYHGHTYTGHTLGCSAALANIHLYQKNNLIKKIRLNGMYLQKKLKEIENSCSIAKRSRCKGLLGAIDLVHSDRQNAEPIEILKNKCRINSFILRESLKLGVFLRSLGNTMLVIPPLAINKTNFGFLLDVIHELIRKVERLS
ncbi:MAG: adenosylmethionine--8-amino-7-oxononanoate transaminase [Nitrososphaeraceae archaeon]